MHQKKKRTDLFEKRIVCEENEYNGYELRIEECLEIHKQVFYRNQNFEVEHRPIEHSCKKENEKIKCRALIETTIQEKLKYRDKKGNKYPDIESFRNKMPLPEIEIQDNLR